MNHYPWDKTLQENYHIHRQKEIAYNHSDPGGTSEKIKEAKTLT